jgi:hypothetical protein
MWYRIFAALDTVPSPAGIEACLGARCSFDADETGWYRAELRCGEETISVERFLADEEGIRAELNAWAAYLETKEDSPHHLRLMERVIQARQLLTVEVPDDQGALGEALCRHLAAVTDGFFQADDRGFFAADGSLFVGEE